MCATPYPIRRSWETHQRAASTGLSERRRVPVDAGRLHSLQGPRSMTGQLRVLLQHTPQQVEAGERRPLLDLTPISGEHLFAQE